LSERLIFSDRIFFTDRIIFSDRISFTDRIIFSDRIRSTPHIKIFLVVYILSNESVNFVYIVLTTSVNSTVKMLS